MLDCCMILVQIYQDIYGQIQKVLPEGSNFDSSFFVFLVCEVRKDTYTTISGPSSAPPAKRHMVFRWHADVGPTLNAGLVAL